METVVAGQLQFTMLPVRTSRRKQELGDEDSASLERRMQELPNENVQAFVDNPASKPAVERALAAVFNLELGHVDATLAPGEHGDVTVDYTIVVVEVQDEGQELVSVIDHTAASALKSALVGELQAAGLTMTVAVMAPIAHPRIYERAAPTISALPTTSTTLPPDRSSSTGGGPSTGTIVGGLVVLAVVAIGGMLCWQSQAAGQLERSQGLEMYHRGSA